MAFKTVSRQNASDDWLTPPAIVHKLGHFDLDPCASRFQTTMLAETNYIWPEHDGLMLPWKGRVWCNPPFANIRRWVDRFFLHHNGILLVPAWTANRWFQSLWYSDSIFFSRRGINFTSGSDPSKNGRSMFGVAIAAATPQDSEALRSLRTLLHGTLVTGKEIL